MQAQLACWLPIHSTIQFGSAFHVPFELIVKVFTGSCHNYHDNLVLNVLNSAFQLVVSFVVENVVTVYAEEISAFRLADGVILPDSVDRFLIQAFQLCILHLLQELRCGR